MTFTSLIQRLGQTLSDHAPTILSGIAVTGSIATAVLSAQGSFKAADILASEKTRRRLETVHNEPITFRDKVELLWPCYVPAISTGAITVSCIIMANRIGTRRAAAMAAAYAVSRDAFSEYKEKVIEKFGQKQESKLRDEIAEDQVRKNPNNKEIVIFGPNEVTCYDSITGRYFKGNVENLRKAENQINRQINQSMYASLTDFYNLIGLASTPYSNEVGWNTDHVFELRFSTILTEDDIPCININFEPYPIRNYW